MPSRHDQDAETLVLWVCGEVLERDDLAAGDDFFSAGGDSIAAMHLIERLRRETGLRLSVRMLFERPVLGSLAELIAGLRVSDGVAQPLSADPRAQLRAAFTDEASANRAGG